MVDVNSVHQSAGLEEPKSESPEAENLVYSVPPSNSGTPRDIDHSRVDRAPEEGTSVLLPIALETCSVLQQRVNNLTTDDSFGPPLKTAKGQNRPASGGKLSRPASHGVNSIPDHKKYKGPFATDPDRNPYDFGDTDAGGSQELPHMQASKKAKRTHPLGAQSPSTRRSFSNINAVAELNKEAIDSSQRSHSVSPVQMAAQVLQPVEPASRSAENLSPKKDIHFGVEEIDPKFGISQDEGLLRGQESGASFLQNEASSNTPPADKEKDSEATRKRTTLEELQRIKGRSSLLGAAEKDLQERLCMAAKAKSADTSERASSETHQPATSKNSKDDSFEAEYIPEGRVKGNRKAPTSVGSQREDTTLKHKTGGEATVKEATVKDKPSKGTTSVEKSKSQDSKPKAGPRLPTGQQKLDNEQATRSKEAELQHEHKRLHDKQPPSSSPSSIPKPAAGARRESCTPIIPAPRSVMKNHNSGIRSTSISSKDTPSRTLGTTPAKTARPETTRSSPTEQRRSISFADPIETSQSPDLPRTTPINGGAGENTGKKSVTHKAKTAKQLDESPTIIRAEPSPALLKELFQQYKNTHPTPNMRKDGGQQVVSSGQEAEHTSTKVGPLRDRSNSRGPSTNPTAAPKKQPLSTLQRNATTVAKSSRKGSKKPINKPAEASDQERTPRMATESSTSFKENSAKKRAKKPLLKSAEEGGVGKLTEQPLNSRGKDATTPSNGTTSRDMGNRVAGENNSAESKSRSRSPAKEVFSSASSSTSDTGSGSESDSESDSEDQSASATNTKIPISNDTGKPGSPKNAKPSKAKTEVPATSSGSCPSSEEDEIPLPKPRQQPKPVSHSKRKSTTSLKTSTKSQEPHNQTDSGTESDEDSPGRQLQREEKQSSQARITSTTSEVAPPSSKPLHSGPKTPLATTSLRAPVNPQFQPMSSMAASAAKTTANGRLTTKNPDYKMSLKSPVTPAAKALMDGAKDEETSEEESSSSDEDEDEDVEVGKGGGVVDPTRSSQASGNGGKNSILSILKCELLYAKSLRMVLMVF